MKEEKNGMLKTTFKKDLDKQYMILEGQEQLEYGIKMLQNNTIEGILEIRIKKIDNKKWYYYNITKQSSLKQLLEKKQISLEKMKEILLQLFQIIEMTKEFLLDEKNLVLEPEMIYLTEAPLLRVKLCYYPFYMQDIMEQIMVLLENFLNHINYEKEEKKKVEQFYKIYDRAKEAGMTCKEFIKEVKKEYENKIKEEKAAFCLKKIEEVVPQTEMHIDKNKRMVSKLSTSVNKIGQEIVEKKSRKENIRKAGPKSNKEKKATNSFEVKNGLEIGLLASFSFIMIGTGIVTNIFRNPTTGMLECEKLGILVIIIAVIDLFVWRIFQKKEEKVKNWELERVVEKLSKEELGIAKQQKYLQQEAQILKEEKVQLEENERENFLEEGTVTLFQEKTVVLKKNIEGEKKWRLIPLAESNNINIEEILLKKFSFYLGKLQWNVDYVLNDPVISRVHSKFEKEGEKLYIMDLDSTNGTYLNHRKLKKDTRQELKNGDEIFFANFKFRLEEV